MPAWHPRGVTAMAPEPSLNRNGKEDAPAGARDPGAAPADEDHQVDACTVWKERYHDLCADFGFDVYEQWLKLCIPESDVDGVLTLAVPTDFFRDHIETHYQDGLQKTLERKVVIVKRGWAADAHTAKAYKERLSEEEAAKKRPQGHRA